MLPAGRNAFLTVTTVGPQHIVRSWPLPSGEQRLVGSMAADGIGRMSVSGTSLAYVEGSKLCTFDRSRTGARHLA